MTIKELEKVIEEKNFWLIDNGNNTYNIKSMRTGNCVFENETLAGIEDCLEYILMKLDQSN